MDDTARPANGTKVRITHDGTHGFSIGAEGFVFRQDGSDMPRVSVGGIERWVGNEKMELVVPPKVPGVFAVGDRVRVTKDGTHSVAIGSVVTLTRSAGLQFDSDAPTPCSFLYPHELEHVDTPATPEPDARLALADKALAWLKDRIERDGDDGDDYYTCAAMLRDVFDLRPEHTPAVPASTTYVSV